MPRTKPVKFRSSRKRLQLRGRRGFTCHAGRSAQCNRLRSLPRKAVKRVLPMPSNAHFLGTDDLLEGGQGRKRGKA